VESTPKSPPDPDRDRVETDRLERRRQSREKYRAADPERARRQHVESQRRSRERERAEQTRRKRARERVRDWTAANPERAQARKEAWKQQNPERVREHKRNYYARNREQRQQAAREQNARRRQDPAVREQELHYRTANREQLNAQQRARRSDPAIRAKDNERQNERRRLDRRLRKLGLPPRPLRRTTINERAANAAAADRFFTRRRGDGQISDLRKELVAIRAEAARGSEERWHAELQARVRADAARPARIRALLDGYLATPAGAILREEVRMDSIARRVRGADPYASLHGELRRRAAAALMARRGGLPSPTPLTERSRKRTLTSDFVAFSA
jgi:hypothetical protein